MKKLLLSLLVLIFVFTFVGCGEEKKPQESEDTYVNERDENAKEGNGETKDEDLSIRDTEILSFTFIRSSDNTPMGQIYFSVEELNWDGNTFHLEKEEEGENRHFTGTFDSEDFLSFNGLLADDLQSLEEFSFVYERKGSIYEYNEIALKNIPLLKKPDFSSYENSSYVFGFDEDIEKILNHIEVWKSGDINYDFVNDTEEVFESEKRLNDFGELRIDFYIMP